MPYTARLTELLPGKPDMEALHRDFFEALDALARCNDDDFTLAYRVFVEKVESAFRQEEAWMEAIDFPAFMLHQEQHARALGALHNMHAYAMRGDIAMCREAVENLFPQWFALHAATMDVTLALAMQVAEPDALQQVKAVMGDEPVPAGQ